MPLRNKQQLPILHPKEEHSRTQDDEMMVRHQVTVRNGPFPAHAYFGVTGRVNGSSLTLGLRTLTGVTEYPDLRDLSARYGNND
jgi:hypothetical protein